ncbi:uncharacterized protein LOC111331402 [Stylophora pistillata]|uniref:uncharacterized protein LOC111331402 n=1 Tax=Stylophora pistillata TaxID=50429 RepID=UPI000C054AE0|nr:uncharacterized protein LOC111331402 [Stylophora pistillata]
MSSEYFLFFLIVSHVKEAYPSKDQYTSEDNCMRFNWKEWFSSRDKQTTLIHMVKMILDDCIANNSKLNETIGGCNDPIVNITFQLFSNSSNSKPMEMEFSSVLAIREESFTLGRQIVHAFAQIWELLVLCIIAAMLSGIIIWFLDYKANSGHFPNSFWRGVRDGWWWAVVTMTTVGYSDKVPKSSRAQVYASLWMIIGMLMMSTITAQISSSVTAEGFHRLDDMFGDKIGVPSGVKKLFERNDRGAIVKEYHTESELLNGLMNDNVAMIMLFDCDTEEMEKKLPRLTIVDVFEGYLNVTVNFTVQEGYKDLEHCFQTTKRETRKSYEHEEMGDYDRDDEREDMQNSCFEKYSHGKNRHNMKQGSSERGVEPNLFILLAFAGILVIFLLIGYLWNVYMKKTRKADDVDIEKGVSDTELRASISSKVRVRELSTPSLDHEIEV